MSGPNPPGPDSEGSDSLDQEPGEPTSEEDSVQDATGETEIHSRAYSAPESEQFTAGPYVAADPDLYDYDEYDKTDLVDTGRPPRWPSAPPPRPSKSMPALCSSIPTRQVSAMSSPLSRSRICP